MQKKYTNVFMIQEKQLNNIIISKQRTYEKKYTLNYFLIPSILSRYR